MPTIVHRRVIRRAVARPRDVAEGPERDPILEPRAPDAGLEAAMGWLSQRLTWVGWLSLAGALVALIVQLRFLVDPGATFGMDSPNLVSTIIRAISTAAAIALPAALELAGPGARRAVPWLMRGAMLIALSEVVRFVVRDLRDRAFSQPESQLYGVDPLDYSQPISLAFAIAAYAPAILLIAGVWALSDGVADAGARPHRRILTIVAAAAVALSVASYLPYVSVIFDPRTGSGILNIASVLVSLVLIALTAVLAVRLLAGSRDLLPRRAWLVAGVAGGCQLVSTFGIGVLQLVGIDLGLLSRAIFAADSAVWVLLAIVFAMGLGRRAGDVAEPTRRLVARWVRYPAS